jgi:hypothetical protein
MERQCKNKPKIPTQPTAHFGTFAFALNTRQPLAKAKEPKFSSRMGDRVTKSIYLYNNYKPP